MNSKTAASGQTVFYDVEGNVIDPVIRED